MNTQGYLSGSHSFLYLPLSNPERELIKGEITRKQSMSRYSDSRRKVTLACRRFHSIGFNVQKILSKYFSWNVEISCPTQTDITYKSILFLIVCQSLKRIAYNQLL